MNSDHHETDLPEAVLRPDRRLSWVWLVPLLAALLIGWIGYRAWLLRGTMITIQLDEGHDLRAGDDVRYRGIAVGSIRSIVLSKDLEGIEIVAALHSNAAGLARAGTRFWVVRPQLNVTGIAGLETLVGPRYLAVVPGDGPPRDRFVGLSDPPFIASIKSGDLEIALMTSRRGSLRAGAPVLYRQVRVGTILSVGLTSDGSGVEARVRIQKAFVRLIRPETRFWNAGGIDASFGIRGMTIQTESLESLLAGGVGMATPPQAGEVVRNGHRFSLADNAQDTWLAWEPAIPIGSSLLPAGAMMPTPMRAVIGWKEGRWIKSDRSRQGWVLQTEHGLLGPADLFAPDEDAREGAVLLEVAGQSIALTGEHQILDDGLAMLTGRVSANVWPTSRQRAAEVPEDCLVFADPASKPLPLATARLSASGQTWLVDSALGLDGAWHGAPVIARKDGKLVGVMLVQDDSAVVALLSK
ncbi:MAG: MCE family protein [Planctomycetes bacterium]|nr:MCE family protein [Planctomycetota bacterium]